MDLQNIFTAIEEKDPEIYQRLDTRRSAMKSFANVGKVLAMSAIPIALGSMFKKAYGRTPQQVIEVLQFALVLENLESAFYNKALADASGLFPTAAAKGAFETIAKHEAAHVILLKSTISALGGTPAPTNTFDFTLDGELPTFTDYATLLTVAQAFEDTGVRAYKGQAGALQENPTVLTVALQIHSVEARHAAHIRRMRGLKGWITSNTSDAAIIASTYAGEDLAVQAKVNITGIDPMVDVNAATESFDEPLSKQAVLDIAGKFIVS